MHTKHLAFALGSLGAGLLACTEMSVEPIKDSQPIVDLTGMSSNDPYACAIVSVSGEGSVINGKEITAVYNGRGGGGAAGGPGSMGWSGASYGALCVRDGTSCSSTDTGFSRQPDGTIAGGADVVCTFSCRDDSDCPQSTGTATARCISLDLDNPLTRPGVCQVTCDVDSDCASGFRCARSPVSIRVPDGGFMPLPSTCLQWKEMGALVTRP